MTDCSRPQPFAPGDVLTVAQAREILPVPRSTLYALISEGTVQGFRIPSVGKREGRILLLRSDLEAFIARMRLENRTGQQRGGRERPNGAVDADAILARVRAEN